MNASFASASVVGQFVSSTQKGEAETASKLLDLQRRMAQCRLCEDQGYISKACAIFSGRATDRIMVIGQAPGRLSAGRRLPFSGPAGRTLASWLEQAGFERDALRTRIYLSSLTKCDPGPSPRGGGDRKPSPREVELCRPFLEEEIAAVRPRAILLLGGMAIQAYLGRKNLEEVVGSYYDWRGALLLSLPHSSGVSRWLNDPAHRRLLDQALAHLSRWREAFDL